MELNEESLRSLVEQVVTSLRNSGSEAEMFRFSGLFSDIDSAVWAARKAQQELVSGTLEMRRQAIGNIRAAVLENLEQLSKMALEETGFGRLEDKIAKNRLAAEMTPGVEDLSPDAWSDDHGLMIVERAPYGVIGAITPSTNPTESIINNGISMIAGGNAVVFNPHPAARKVSAYTVGLMNDAVRKAGGPDAVFCTLTEPTIESATAMMNHPLVQLLVVTGGPAVVKAAMKTDKKVIAAGPGNPPVVVDETADIEKAARDIVAGASFDNNIICIDEKEIIAVRTIADRLKEEMAKHGARELSGDEIERVTKLVIEDPGRPGHEGSPNKAFVGKDAAVIAGAAGIDVPADTRILLMEVDRSHPLVWTEQLMPVIPLVRVDNVDDAIDFAVECEHGFRHTASMHSLNIAKLSKMARVMNCSLYVKNGSNFNGMAAGGAGFTSYTIASPTGEGFTRARTFTRERRCSLIDYFRIV